MLGRPFSRKNVSYHNNKHLILDVADSYFYYVDAPPITTLTWFKGDYQNAKQYLENRLKLIMKKNPWIGGRLGFKFERGFQLYLSYSLDNSIDDIFTTVEAEKSPIARNTPFVKYDKCLKDYKIKSNKNEPLFKTTIIPCFENPNHRFAVMVQMSHSVGDGATYYKLLEMLFSIEEDTILKLNEVRIKNSQKQQIALMGKNEERLFRSLGCVLNILWGLLVSILLCRPMNPQFEIVDLDKMETAKKEAAKDGDVQFVSTNDIITSWYLQQTQSEIGFMAINWRNRLDGHSMLDVGNYENLLYYSKEDSATPSLIRQSLTKFKRVVTKDNRLPGFFTCFGSPCIPIVTNWASFAKRNDIKGCEEDCHIPFTWGYYYPTTMPVLIIFRAGVGQLGLCSIQAGAVNFLNHAPFLKQSMKTKLI